MPNRKRTAIMDGALQASVVADVNRDHQVTIMVSTRRGPHRSPSQATGIWKSA